MQNSRNTRRQSWLTASRITTVTGIVVIVAILVVMIGKVNNLLDRSFMPINTVQATKVEQASAYLQDVGFSDPLYLGVKPATEGEYPTFSATAIGGQSVELMIRTMPNGGWEIQPVGMFESVASADDFARVAQQAVLAWEGISPNIKPRTGGTSGDYESKKYNYDLLKKYNPPSSYWSTAHSETEGWPRK